MVVVVVVVVWQFEESLPTYTLLADQLGLGQRPHWADKVPGVGEYMDSVEWIIRG